MKNEKKITSFLGRLSNIATTIKRIEEELGSDMVSVDIFQDAKDGTWGFDITATDTDSCLFWKDNYKTLLDLQLAMDLVMVGARLANGKEV